MARIYTRCVAIFVLPFLLFLWFVDYVGRTPLSHGNSSIDQLLDGLRPLSAWFFLWSNAGRNGTSWSNWGSLIGLLGFGFVFFSLADWLYERSARSLVASIAALLDKGVPAADPVSSRWESTFIDISSSGKLNGRAMSIALHASYAQRFNYNWLKLDLACRSPWHFEIRPRSAVERVLEKWELSQEGTELGDSFTCSPTLRPSMNGLVRTRSKKKSGR
jgi:hypothetical protein